MYWNEDDKEIASRKNDVQINDCKQLKSNLNYFNKTNLNNDLYFSRFEMSKQVGHNDYKDLSGNNFRSDNRSDKKSNDSCSKDKLDIHDSNLKTLLGNNNAAFGHNDYKDAKKDSISVERTRSLYIQKVIKNK